MRLLYSATFKQQYQHLPEDIRERVKKQLALLLSNPRHPSLNTKKLKGLPGLWQGRVTKSCRFVFRMEGDAYHLILIHPHA